VAGLDRTPVGLAEDQVQVLPGIAGGHPDDGLGFAMRDELVEQWFRYQDCARRAAFRLPEDPLASGSLLAELGVPGAAGTPNPSGGAVWRTPRRPRSRGGIRSV
jgi:hypothetical protein